MTNNALLGVMIVAEAAPLDLVTVPQWLVSAASILVAVLATVCTGLLLALFKLYLQDRQQNADDRQQNADDRRENEADRKQNALDRQQNEVDRQQNAAAHEDLGNRIDSVKNEITVVKSDVGGLSGKVDEQGRVLGTVSEGVTAIQRELGLAGERLVSASKPRK